MTKVLIAISAPGFGKPTGARSAQYQWTNLAAALHLVATRVEMGSEGGSFDNNGIAASWRVELEPVAKPADDEAA